MYSDTVYWKFKLKKHKCLPLEIIIICESFISGRWCTTLLMHYYSLRIGHHTGFHLTILCSHFLFLIASLLLFNFQGLRDLIWFQTPPNLKSQIRWSWGPSWDIPETWNYTSWKRIRCTHICKCSTIHCFISYTYTYL